MLRCRGLNVPVMASARAMGVAATAVARTAKEARVVKGVVNFMLYIYKVKNDEVYEVGKVVGIVQEKKDVKEMNGTTLLDPPGYMVRFIEWRGEQRWRQGSSTL